ncbi:MAG: FliO/MopB family protein [Sphingomonadales bacterium]|nr:FliO/MopB family protein [Sphingomonadales bacterium]
MDLESYSKFILALGLVVALIVLSAWLIRRLGLIPGQQRPKKGNGRLSLVETLPLDIHRKLVIVKRDNVEHLLVLGQNNETVIESPIPPSQPRAPQSAAHGNEQE